MIRYLFFTLLFIILACQDDKKDIITMKSKLSLIKINLISENPPIAVGNFLKHINEKRYKDFYFHRTINLNNQSNKQLKIIVIQGGFRFKTLSELS